MSEEKGIMAELPIWNLVKVILFIAGAVYIALALFMTVAQSWLVYQPTHEIESNPQSIGLAYDEVRLRTSDNVLISGWYIPCDSSIATIMICHGNAGNISHRLETIKIFHDLGLAVFIFDYRGYGNSTGSPSEKGTYIDAEAAWDYLTNTKNIAPDSIILFGRSLGGPIAAYIAEKYNPRGLILESTMTSIPDIASKMYPFLPVRLLSRFDYNTLEYLKNIHCPVLIIHSPDDEIIPYENGEKLFAAANEPKTFLQIKGSHNDGFWESGDEYKDGLNKFISNSSRE